MITEILDKIDSFMYYPILIIVMAIAGLYYTIFTRGVARSADVSGAPYVQNALSSVIGHAGPVFITVALMFFAFTTLFYGKNIGISEDELDFWK